MPEQKQMMNQEMEMKKEEKPVSEVKDSKDLSKLEVEKSEAKKEEKKNKKEKSKEESAAPVKSEAIVNGRDLRISTKHAAAICDFIRNKNIEIAMHELKEVLTMKRAIPMRGEIPHRKGKGMMSGRYPINATKEFIKLLKSLKANAINNELELEKVKIAAMANVASRPRTSFGQAKHKRSHVQIKLMPITKRQDNKIKEKKK